MTHENPDSDTDPTSPEEHGEWEPVRYRFNHLPIHLALLHTGKVLAFGGSGNDETRLRNPHPAEIFDPQAGTVEIVDQQLDGDVFCVGHAFLPDGRLLAAGGTYRYDGDINLFDLIDFPLFSGLDQAYLFDPKTERWTRVQDMVAGRWYPTLVTLGDGSILTAAGLTKHPPWVVLRKFERYTPGKGWSVMHGAGRWLPLYPRLHLLSNGDLFYAGSYNTHYTFPFSLRNFPTAVLDLETFEWTDYGLPNEEEREEGASVLLPLRPETDYRSRILLVGGGTPTGTEAINNAELIDFGDEQPHWRSVDPMKHPRYYTYAVLLPDGTVFVMGGRSGKTGHVDDIDYDPETGEVSSIPNAVHEAELFDPETETWTPLASMTVDRLYHSGALLLSDGRVMTAGSNPKRRVDELRIEIYSPPYLFNGPRPEIAAVPETVTHGDTFAIEMADESDVDEVVLLRQSSTTHCLNTDQRLVELPIEEHNDRTIRTLLPENSNITPPGYYMLFALRDAVPSVGQFIQIRG